MNSNNCLISVIIPVYNVEKYITRCLKSLKKQTLQNWEAILIDDCSPDNSIRTAQKITDTDSRFKIIRNQQNLGQGCSRDAGIAVSSGKYILMLDSDDYLAETALQKLFEAAEEENADITVCSVKQLYRHSSRIYPDFPRKHSGTGKDFLFSLFFNWIYPTTFPNVEAAEWNKLIKRDFWEKHHFKHLHGRLLGEDFYIVSQLLFHASKVVCIPDVLYFYDRRNTSSMTASRELELLMTQLHVYQKLVDFFKEERYFSVCSDHFYAHIYRHLYFEVMEHLSYFDDKHNKKLLQMLSENLQEYDLWQTEKRLWQGLELFYNTLSRTPTRADLRLLKFRKLKIQYIPLWLTTLKHRICKPKTDK